PIDFTDADLALLDEIGETIIPATNIPGAKAVGVGAFIAMMVADCYAADAQAEFKTGLARLPADYKARYDENFIGGKKEHRTAFLNTLDAEQRAYTAGRNRTVSPPHYFRILRELTILGYFTSEIGATQAVHYLEVPGRYDGNVPYQKGDVLFV
ncbi:MAG TPA: gluconate 2-dehydrogenase subunit 3 family protein, partial [Lacunisphaera sp.]|nr:gluconate 2-dehydrogenase subunit 3 family protein [Lacunisphaera sp.]